MAPFAVNAPCSSSVTRVSIFSTPEFWLAGALKTSRSAPVRAQNPAAWPHGGTERSTRVDTGDREGGLGTSLLATFLYAGLVILVVGFAPGGLNRLLTTVTGRGELGAESKA